MEKTGSHSGWFLAGKYGRRGGPLSGFSGDQRIPYCQPVRTYSRGVAVQGETGSGGKGPGHASDLGYFPSVKNAACQYCDEHGAVTGSHPGGRTPQGISGAYEKSGR